MCCFWNLVRILRFSSSSSSISYLALSIPAFSLLVTFYIGVFFLKRSGILSSVDCFYYIKIRCLNSSILSYSRRLSDRSLTSLYFLTNVLTFRSLVRTLYLTSKSSRSIYLSPSLTAICITDSLICKEAPYFLPIGVLIRTPNS